MTMGQQGVCSLSLSLSLSHGKFKGLLLSPIPTFPGQIYNVCHPARGACANYRVQRSLSASLLTLTPSADQHLFGNFSPCKSQN